MGYFPFFTDIKNKEILIVGGGSVALRKAEKLLTFEPKITVVAPDIRPEILALNVKTAERRFEESDLDGKFCVISAADDSELNALVYKLCRERKIAVNTVDDKEKCSFIFPALCVRGDVTVGISTSGTSPIFAAYLRRKIDEMLDGRAEETAEIMASYRPVISQLFGGEDARKRANAALLKLCLSGNDLPNKEEIDRLLGSLKDDEDKNRNEKF